MSANPYHPLTVDGLAAATVAAVAVATVTVIAFLATAAAAMVTGLKFLGGSIAYKLYEAAVAYRFAGELVVEVHEHLVVSYLYNLALDAHAFLGHHGHTRTGTDVLGVKLAIDVEDFLLEFINKLRVLHTEGLMGLQGEIELLALLQAHDVVLEALDEREIHTEDEGIRVFLVELEHALLLIAIDDKNLIHELYVFTSLNFLHFV